MNAPSPHGVLLEETNQPGVLHLLVRGIQLQAEGIHAFELAHPDGEMLPAVEAGAHVDVHPAGGLVRSYSLAGDPGDRSRWILGVLRDERGRGGSRAMHDNVRVGNLVAVGTPRNAFPLVENAEHTILLGGGIGITPLKAMAHVLAREGRSFELHYCARTPRHAAFSDELRALVPLRNLHFHFDGGDPARALDIGALLADAAGGRHVYYCGPGGFMRACAEATRHWHEDTVHSEHFKPPEMPSSCLPAGCFEVKLARSGATVQVDADQTIVRAMELAGYRVPTSCLSGLCGACKVGYLEGEVDHRDYILTDEEKNHCLTICVSRSKSQRLVLDL